MQRKAYSGFQLLPSHTTRPASDAGRVVFAYTDLYGEPIRTILHMRRATPILFLLLLLQTASSQVAAGQASSPSRSWWARATVASSRYYEIKSDLPKEDFVRYARHLDRMYEEYAQRFSSLRKRNPGEAMNVMIFRKQSDYLYVLRTRYGIDGTGSGGMFFMNRRGQGLALWVESLPERRVHHVIQHEGFHQYAYTLFGNDLPIWVNEGLAEFFGEAVLVGNTLVLGQTTPRVLRTLKGAIENDEHVPFGQMVNMSSAEWNNNVKSGGAALQYRQAWSMVHFLIYGQDARYQSEFERYLRKLNIATPPDAAWNDVFGPNLAPFELAWKEFALAARPSAFRTALERIEFMAEGALELSRRGSKPTSLDELQTQLVEIGFRQEVVGHGSRSILRATDPVNFAIPADDFTDTAEFVVESRRRRLNRREKMWEEKQPMPPDIKTDGLRPNRITVEWSRDRETGAISYELRVR